MHLPGASDPAEVVSRGVLQGSLWPAWGLGSFCATGGLMLRYMDS